MMTLLRQEMKQNRKMMFIWSLSVGLIGLGCILLYSSMQEAMDGMAESFASMGAFSEAFGMDKLGLDTMLGYYATEIGTIHALGGAMFAALLGSFMLSKEEDGHTGEFLYTLPISRGNAVTSKYLSMVLHIILFNLICVACYVVALVMLGEDMPWKEYALYHLLQFVMHVVLGSICFAISAFMKRNRMGVGLGLVLALYAYDMMARVIPDLKDYQFLSPFSFAGAADILSSGEVYRTGLILGIVMLFASFCLAWGYYTKKDLAS